MCRLRATRDDFATLRLQNLLGFEPMVLISPPIAKNKQQFADLIQRVKEFKDKWLNN